MRLSPFLHPDLVIADLSAADFNDAVGQMVQAVLSVHDHLERSKVVESLLERERAVSTGLEKGVAVPHATVEGLDQTVLVVVRLARPIEMDTLDDSPVQILFMMLSPAGAIASHVRLLARLARLCSGKEFLTAILEAPDSAALYDLVRQEDGGHV